MEIARVVSLNGGVCNLACVAKHPTSLFNGINQIRFVGNNRYAVTVYMKNLKQLLTKRQNDLMLQTGIDIVDVF